MNDHVSKKKFSATAILAGLATAVFLFGVTFSMIQQGSFERIWQDMVVRPAGPFGTRFILQPLVAASIALIDGIADAKAGRQPYFWRITHDKEGRWDRLMEGLRAVANVLSIAVILDTLYQLVVMRTFFWFETVLVAILLAFVPYMLMRGVVERLARALLHHAAADQNGGAK